MHSQSLRTWFSGFSPPSARSAVKRNSILLTAKLSCRSRPLPTAAKSRNVAIRHAMEMIPILCLWNMIFHCRLSTKQLLWSSNVARKLRAKQDLRGSAPWNMYSTTVCLINNHRAAWHSYSYYILKLLLLNVSLEHYVMGVASNVFTQISHSIHFQVCLNHCSS